MRRDLTMLQVNAVRTMLADAGMDDDERLLLDTLEGETDLFELSRRLLDGIERDEADVNALAEQIDARRARQARCKARVEARREAVGALMECAGVEKLTLPEATVSWRRAPPKLVVTDEAAVPDDLCTFTRKPNMAAIKAAAEPVPGTSLDNGGVSITVRRK